MAVLALKFLMLRYYRLAEGRRNKMMNKFDFQVFRLATYMYIYMYM